MPSKVSPKTSYLPPAVTRLHFRHLAINLHLQSVARHPTNDCHLPSFLPSFPKSQWGSCKEGCKWRGWKGAEILLHVAGVELKFPGFVHGGVRGNWNPLVGCRSVWGWKGYLLEEFQLSLELKSSHRQFFERKCIIQQGGKYFALPFNNPGDCLMTAIQNAVIVVIEQSCHMGVSLNDHFVQWLRIQSQFWLWSKYIHVLICIYLYIIVTCIYVLRNSHKKR